MVLRDHGEEGIALISEALAMLQGAHRDRFWRALLTEAHRGTG